MEKNDDIHDIIENSIENFLPFGDILTAAEKQTFIDCGAVHSADKGEVLCKQGEKDRRVFIIIFGEAEVSEDNGKDNVVLTQLKRGEVFGEISALFEPERVSTVVATKPSVFLILSGEVFEKVISGRSELYNAILERYKSRISEIAVRGVDLFRSLGKNEIAPLIEASTIVGIPENKVIIKQGEMGDYFYIMIRGSARVSVADENKTINVALIHPGDYFGEWSVLTGSPRAATVTATSRVDLLRIGRDDMFKFCKSHLQLANQIDEVANSRYENLRDVMIPDSEKHLQEWMQNLENVIKNGFK